MLLLTGLTTSPRPCFVCLARAGDPRQRALRFSVLSGSNMGWGYYNAFRAAAASTNDFILLAGNFITNYAAPMQEDGLKKPSADKAVRK